MLEFRIDRGLDYYDVPLFQNAPGFPFALVISHRFFAAKDKPYSSVATRDNANFLLAKSRPTIIFDTQFYLTIVPFLFSILTVGLIFFLAKRLFSAKVGLYAALIYAIDPVNIMTSQRIWADDMLTFFVLLSVFLFIISLDRKNPLISFLSGAACGAAIMTKQTALLMVPVISSFYIYANSRYLMDIKKAPRIIFNRYNVCFLLGVLALTWFWFHKVYEVYGTPFFTNLRDLSVIVKNDKSGWHEMLSRRPHAYILYLVGTIYLSPLFMYAFYSLRYFILEIKKERKELSRNMRMGILWIWVLTFYLLSFAIGKEERYMLPMHPALAILAAVSLVILQNRIRPKKAGTMIVCIILALSIWWSVSIGIEYVMLNHALIVKPF